MPRPPLPVGTAGKIGFTTLGRNRVRARVMFRDYDGVTRPVTRYGTTRPAAERRLKEALRDRIGPTHGKITADTKIDDLAPVWLAEVKASDLADGSKELYERTLNFKVLPALGALRCRECDVPACDRFLKAVRENYGPGAAKTCKTVLSLLLALAVRHGAIPANPVRDVGKIPRGSRRQPRALTVEQEVELLTKIATDPAALAGEDDVADLVEFLSGTGVRIGEALGVRAGVVDVTAGVLEVNAIAVRLKDKGTVLQLRPKTAAGWRVIALPRNVVEVCQRRMNMAWPGNEHGLLFPTRLGQVRSPSNANRDLKAAAKRIDPGLDWVTSHTFRKTVATRLDEAGLTARAIADHLGHAKPSMTQDVYMGRGVASAEAAKILDRTTT